MISIVRAFLAGLALLGVGSPAAAAPSQVVVELFTSQGCSSCPPADAYMVELARRTDVIALTFPVDYWDYLGWKDTLAQPSFSARQRGYAHARRDRQVFTPQMVVNGMKSCIGSDRGQIERWITVNAARIPPATVTMSEQNGNVVIDVEGETEAFADVWILPIVRSQTVPIGRGENRGRTVTYANVARGVTRIGEWQGGKARFETPLRASVGQADGYVVLLQTLDGGRPGPIVGAAKSPGL
jgi:hypothetical protein